MVVYFGMNYQQILDWMFAQLPMYQKQGKVAYKKDLSNSIAFAKHLKNPERKFKSIHVAGTNGKGSTASIIASVLQEAGYKTGLYTSPHLNDFRERIRINAQMITKSFILQFITKNKYFLTKNQLSFFELSVGMAFNYFADKKVDFAVIEVGMGGRLDSTNIIDPELSVITNIGLDHTEFLGDTLEKIATEKAGVIKRNTPVVIGECQEKILPVFKCIAKSKNAPLIISNIKKHHQTDLLGGYQQKNCNTAITALKNTPNINIKDSNIETGLKKVKVNTGLFGRWQILGYSPKIICDTGHNKEGLSLVLTQLKKESFKNLHVVLGMGNSKNHQPILALFPKDAQYYFCAPKLPRALPVKALEKLAVGCNLTGNNYPSVTSAFAAAKQKAAKDDLIFVGGSTFVVAEICPLNP